MINPTPDEILQIDIPLYAYGDDGGPCVYVFAFDYPTDEEMHDFGAWTKRAVRLDFRTDDELTQFVGRLCSAWPRAYGLYFACACCCDTDLVRLGSCTYCGIWMAPSNAHLNWCPMLMPDGSDEQHERIQAFSRAWRSGYRGTKFALSALEGCSPWIKAGYYDGLHERRRSQAEG